MYRPCKNTSAGLGFSAFQSRDLNVKSPPFLDETVRVGVVDHGPYFTFASSDDSTWLRYSPHLAQSKRRIGHMLKYLMNMHNVERIIRKIQREYIPDFEFDVRKTASSRERASFFEHFWFWLDTDDVTLRRESCEVGGDGPRTAAYVENPRIRLDYTRIHEICS